VGTRPRQTLKCPPIYNFDLTLSERFATSESTNLLFRSEFFNAFNTPQFSLRASTIGNTGVGTISSTARANRQIQFAAKFSFELRRA
jgi:hypothetical protein